MWPLVAECGRHEPRDPQHAVDVRVEDGRLVLLARLRRTGTRPSASPALLKRMSIPPSSATAASTNAALERLVGHVERERDVRVDALDRAVPRLRRALRPRGSFRTVEAPMPDDAPVTTAVLPERSMAASLTATGVGLQSDTCSSSTRSIVTALVGRSRASRSTSEMRSTTSCPDETWPKTVCFPSSHGHASAVTRKNCDPFVFGPRVGHRERTACDRMAVRLVLERVPGAPRCRRRRGTHPGS